MVRSESLNNALLSEVDSLSFRFRNIKHCLKMTSNNRFKERLINENFLIYDRIYEISKVAELLNKRSNEKISFSALLLEKSRRVLKEIKSVGYLFFL